LASAKREGEIVYAVPGHPLVAEETVQLLLQQGPAAGVEIEIKGGHSFLDAVFTALKVDPVEGFILLDATRLVHAQLQPDMHQLICQVYDRFVASDLKLTLMSAYPDDYPVKLITAAGDAGQEQVRSLPLYELDRLNAYGNLTTVYVPPTRDEPVLNRCFWRLREIVAILRGPEGCPWDREQTHQSLRKYLLEETYEVLETIEEEDFDAMCEEMGDLLLQIMLHAQMAEEEGFFTIEDVVATLNEKLIRRHPHVFGDWKARDAEEVAQRWEAIKVGEKKAKDPDHTSFVSLLDEVPKCLPALSKAYKYQKKAAKVGFDWDNPEDVKQKVMEEWQELSRAQTPDQQKEEMGDLLFSLINLARFLKIDPEEALTLTNRKFKQRFQYIESQLQKAGRTWEETPLEVMESWWKEAKALGLRNA
jgi:tetrapyrrole methylase family protein/MazG family protein